MWQLLETLGLRLGVPSFFAQAQTGPPGGANSGGWAESLFSGTAEVSFVYVSIAVGLVLTVVLVTLVRRLAPKSSGSP